MTNRSKLSFVSGQESEFKCDSDGHFFLLQQVTSVGKKNVTLRKSPAPSNITEAGKTLNLYPHPLSYILPS